MPMPAEFTSTSIPPKRSRVRGDDPHALVDAGQVRGDGVRAQLGRGLLERPRRRATSVSS